MTSEEARLRIIEGINYAAYKETDSSLHDSDKNRLFGSERYNSGRHVVNPWEPAHLWTSVSKASAQVHKTVPM